jgi:hypothetical protein
LGQSGLAIDVIVAADLKAKGGGVVGFFSYCSLLFLLSALVGKSGKEWRLGQAGRGVGEE